MSSGEKGEEIRVADLKNRLEDARDRIEETLAISDLPAEAKETLEFAKNTVQSVGYALGGLEGSTVVWPSIIIPNPVPDPPTSSRGCLLDEGIESS